MTFCDITRSREFHYAESNHFMSAILNNVMRFNEHFTNFPFIIVYVFTKWRMKVGRKWVEIEESYVRCENNDTSYDLTSLAA